jgi:hypothetical protein
MTTAKKLFVKLSFLLLITSNLVAQSNLKAINPVSLDSIKINKLHKESSFFIEFAFDPKMSLKGPGGSYERKTSFHYNVGLGYQTDRVRVSSIYSSHKYIDYTKFTYVKVDYKVFKFQKIDLMAGVEMSKIFRKDSDTSSLGVNLESTMHVTKNISVGLRWSTFMAEEALINDGKPLRSEGLIVLYYKL